jgi:tRNA-Thr(GGU) m(6)t(6)A37 methyltransferase TsaA
MSDVVLQPIGIVRSPRRDVEDDDWGAVVSTIELDAGRFGAEVTAGLADFSHVEVVYHFHRVPPEKIETAARHPRNRTDWPKVGIFAQRGKGRPNRLGVSRCRLLSVAGRTLTVQALDAVDGTPVLDVKPWIAEFGPLGDVRQPAWATELMAGYYR